MKKQVVITYFIAFVLLPVFIVGCSEVQSTVTDPQTVGTHPDGFAAKTSMNFHSKYLKTVKWDMTTCTTCHAANFTGGTTGTSCLSCHTQTAGPKACNTCHGSFTDSTLIAPPQALNDDTVTTYKGVGAHSVHLFANLSAKQVQCIACHTVPATFDAAGHLDNTAGAELVWGDIADDSTNKPGGFSASGTPVVPVPAYAAGSCSNVYCHGYFKNGNKTNTVSWTGGSSQAACGTCHGIRVGNPRPGGNHVTMQSCGGCHSNVGKMVVTGTDTTYVIDSTQASKHINGKLSVFGNEYSNW